MTEFRPSSDSDAKIVHMLRRIEKLKNSEKRIYGTDVFAEAGGLTTDRDLNGFLETKYAVELDTLAYEMLRRNHPNITVFNQGVKVILKRVAEEREGIAEGVLKDLTGKGMPRMPHLGKM
jgi:hypothetical protein